MYYNTKKLMNVIKVFYITYVFDDIFYQKRKISQKKKSRFSAPLFIDIDDARFPPHKFPIIAWRNAEFFFKTNHKSDVRSKPAFFRDPFDLLFGMGQIKFCLRELNPQLVLF